MTTTVGPFFAGTAANNNDGGNVAWTNPGNATGSGDSVYATCALTKQIGGVTQKSQRLRLTNYGFSLPTGGTLAVVAGIKVEIRGQCNHDANGDGCTDIAVQLLIGGAETGNTANGNLYPVAAGFMPAYGSTTDTWGLTAAQLRTVSNFNNTNFGVSIKVENISILATETAQVDAVRITIYYDETAITDKLDLNRPNTRRGVPKLRTGAMALRLQTAMEAAVPVVYLPINVSCDGTSALTLDTLTEFYRFSLSLAGTSSLSATPVELHRFSLALSGTSSLSTTFRELHRINVSLAGTSALVPAVTEYLRFSATLAGSSSLSAGVTEYLRITATLAGTSSLATAIHKRLPIVASLAGTSTLTTDITIRGPLHVTFAGASSLISTLLALRQFTLTLDGSSTLSASARELQRFTVDFDGQGTVQASVVEFAGVTVTFTGTSEFTQNPVFRFSIFGTSTLDIVTDFAPPPSLTGSKIFGRAGTLTGSTEHGDNTLTGEKIDDGDGTLIGIRTGLR